MKRPDFLPVPPRLIAEPALREREFALRCSVMNPAPQTVYLLCLDFQDGRPTADIRYLKDGEVEIRSGGLEPLPRHVPCYPARNAGISISSGQSTNIEFRWPIPVTEAGLVATGTGGASRIVER